MRLKELEAQIYADMRSKLPHIKPHPLDYIFKNKSRTNKDYINLRIKEMDIQSLIKEFGPEADVWLVWMIIHKPEELSRDLLAKAMADCYSGKGGTIPPGFGCSSKLKQPCSRGQDNDR